MRLRLRRWWTFALGRGRRGPLIGERAASVLGNGGFVVMSASFLASDILTLRELNIVASCMMLMFNAFALERPVWIALRWGGLFIVINGVKTVGLLRDRRTGILPEREALVYARSFAGRGLSEALFWRLVEEGEWQELPHAAALTKERVQNEYVYLLAEGCFSIKRRGHVLHDVSFGSWIGERGFLRNHLLPGARRPIPQVNALVPGAMSPDGPAFATVEVSSERARVLRWRRDDLLQLMQREPAIRSAIVLSITEDLLLKLQMGEDVSSQNKGFAEKWEQYRSHALVRRRDRGDLRHLWKADADKFHRKSSASSHSPSSPFWVGNVAKTIAAFWRQPQQSRAAFAATSQPLQAQHAYR